ACPLPSSRILVVVVRAAPCDRPPVQKRSFAGCLASDLVGLLPLDTSMHGRTRRRAVLAETVPTRARKGKAARRRRGRPPRDQLAVLRRSADSPSAASWGPRRSSSFVRRAHASSAERKSCSRPTSSRRPATAAAP